MKKVELLKSLKEFNKNEDLYIIDFDSVINVDINDFEGFDKDYNEIKREVTIDINEFIEFLQKNSKSYKQGKYSSFVFEDCALSLGYTSYEI